MDDTVSVTLTKRHWKIVLQVMAAVRTNNPEVRDDLNELYRQLFEQVMKGKVHDRR